MADPRIVRAVVEMERNLPSVDADTLYRDAGLSPAAFANLFGAETGLSPGGYLLALRMERARMLLERTFLTVRQVTTQVGAADPRGFAADFRRYHGRSPRDIRSGQSDAQRSRFLTAHLALVESARAEASTALRRSAEASSPRERSQPTLGADLKERKR